MKTLLIISVLAGMTAAFTPSMAQDQPDEYLGLPGDNLNLYAVMNLFQKSETLEGFERSLNDENSRINNLDLNNDNLIDYIKVMDYVDKNVHTIVLRDLLGPNESQDVAVFTVQKFRNGTVQIQLIGDEALYGKNYIIEPIPNETPNPGYTGNQNVTVVRTDYVEVAAWPVIRFIFLPNYVVWHSSWYWGYYPHYWHPWSPFSWHYYYGYHYHWYPDYYSYYRPWHYHRYSHWNSSYYHNRRVYSNNVIININAGHYRTTYSHPEQRRDGEAYFSKAHPERALRTSTGNYNERRSVSQMSDTRSRTGSSQNSSYRSNSNTNNNSGVNRNNNSNNSYSRRANSGEGVKSSVNQSSNRNNGNYGRPEGNQNKNAGGNSFEKSNNAATPRSTTTLNNRANPNSTAATKTVSNRRSSEAVNSRSESKQSSGQRTESSRSSNRSEIKTGSADRKSSGNGKAESGSKKNNDSKVSKETQRSRRK